MIYDLDDLNVTVSRALMPLDDSRVGEFFRYLIFTGTQIVSYNDRVCIAQIFNTDFENKVAVNAKVFYNLLPKVGASEVEIKETPTSLIIKTNKTKASIAKSNAEELINKIDQINFEPDWKPLPQEFLAGLAICSDTASKDPAEPAMNCVYVNGSTIAATDDVRVSEFKMASKFNGKILIPAKTAKEVCSLEGLTHYAVSDAFVSFRDKGNSKQIHARLVNLEFPMYQFLFKFDIRQEITLPVEEVEQAARYVMPTAVEDEYGYKPMDIKIRGSKCTFKTMNPDAAFAQYTFKLGRPADDIYFEINPSFLIHAIGIANNLKIGDDCALFETGNFRHLVALMGE